MLSALLEEDKKEGDKADESDAHLSEELTATMPSEHEWVVHFTNSGAEAIDLALMMARVSTGNQDVILVKGSRSAGMDQVVQALQMNTEED